METKDVNINNKKDIITLSRNSGQPYNTLIRCFKCKGKGSIEYAIRDTNIVKNLLCPICSGMG